MRNKFKLFELTLGPSLIKRGMHKPLFFYVFPLCFIRKGASLSEGGKLKTANRLPVCRTEV